MNPKTSIVNYIETYVNSSTSPAQQNASANAIASLLKNDVITMEYLVREMELYLTTTDDILRARGLLLLAKVLGLLQLKHLNDATIHTLVGFFTERLTDWRALHGALVGCLALVRRKSSEGVVTVADAKALAQSYLENVQVQSLGPQDRKLCFELLHLLLARYPDSFSTLGDHLVYGVCEASEDEKDPHCLMHVFQIVESMGRIFPDPAGPVASMAEELFDRISCYFPIHYTHPKNEDVDVSRDDLSRALMIAFSASPFFEPFAIPLLLEKLSSTLPLAKIDSLKYLSHCVMKYEPQRIAKYFSAIWSSVKAAIYDSPLATDPLVSDLSHGMGFQESEITIEALNLLQKIVLKQNNSFLNLVLQDVDVRSFIGSVADSGSRHKNLPQNKQKLYTVGRLISVLAKASTSSCNVVFESVFIRLSDALWLPPISGPQNDVKVDSSMPSLKLSFSALYLCIEILNACRELATSSAGLTPSTSSLDDSWCHKLSGCSCSLVKTFVTDLVAADEIYHNSDVSLRVKGLQILATFPGASLPVSTSLFDSILVTLVSTVTEKSSMTSLWKVSLNALTNIGTFLQEYPYPEKLRSYSSTVVDRIVLMISPNDSTMPYPLVLEALSEICVSGSSFMSRIIKGVQDAMSDTFTKIYVNGDMEHTEELVQLLECYSSKLLPRYHEVKGSESMLVQFATDIWDQIEAAMKLNFFSTGEALLNAIKKTIKLAVTMCSEDEQRAIFQKARKVILSDNSFSPKFVTSQLEGLRKTQDIECLNCRDKWLVSLFASVIIALHPQTQSTITRDVIEVLLVTFLKGDVTSAQALGSIVNKMVLEDNQLHNPNHICLDDILELIFRATLGSCRDFFLQYDGETVNQSESCQTVSDCLLLQTNSISGLAWIGKGLLMRGHERLKDITMIFLKFLVSSSELEALFNQITSLGIDKGTILSLTKSAADAFHVFLSDSEDCLNKTFHASVRPLYKQRFFSLVMPILLSSATKSHSREARSMLYRAIGHVICDAPIAAVLNESKKFLPTLVDVITVLSEDILNKDLIYNLLLVLSGLLLDKNGQETASENTTAITNCLIGLLSYPHKMLVRETAIQCLVAMTAMPHTRIYPIRIQVLKALSKVLDDPKRSVRVEAVRCRHAWASIV